MIRQVRLKEMYMDATGTLTERLTPVFAFGTHPQVESPDEAHPVTSAKSTNNKLRIIMDELLVGNHLEEIACRGQVDDDNYDTVVEGSTPDDIARCAVAKDVLKSSCPGSFSHAVCICKLDGGCGETAKGEPVGVLDVNQDGAADDTRFIDGAVGLRCGDVDVPIDRNNSYWNPSGDQNVPAMGGFEALGPAIVLQPIAPAAAPMGTTPFLPTNTECKLTFADNIVDKQRNKVCAPPDGDITKGCTPGNVDAFTFKVEPLTASTGAFSDGDTGVSRVDPVNLRFTAPLDPTTVMGITVTEGTTAYTQFTLTQPSPDIVRITWTAAGGLAANTMYTITIPVSVKDFFKQPMPMPTTISFTTGS